MDREISPARTIAGTLTMPGDKSIAHRALILGALAEGTSRIQGLPDSQDVASTLHCLTQLGVQTDGGTGDGRTVQGRGLRGFMAPGRPLDAGNSGTTARLLMGVLAAQPFDSVIDGDASLRKRPMARVAGPLSEMGARFSWLGEPGCLPVQVHGAELQYAELQLEVASAQVKSALLLAGMCAGCGCRVSEMLPTRNHTELMLAAQRVPVTHDADGLIVLKGGTTPQPLDMRIPGDISSAAFFIGAAAMVPDSHVTVARVGLNAGRIGLLGVLREMGARVYMHIENTVSGEPVGTIDVHYSRLGRTSIGPGLVPSIVDELPLLAVLATQAEGTTVVSGARELRFKESDRIAVLAQGLRCLGVAVKELPDGFSIEGPQQILGGNVESHGDHRIAMALAVAALSADAPVKIHGAECVAVSFPSFWELLEEVVQHD